MDGWKQEVREDFRGLEAGSKTAAAEGVNTNARRGLISMSVDLSTDVPNLI